MIVKSSEVKHVVVFKHKEKASGNAYLPHPEHKKFGELVGKLDVLEESFGINFQGTQ